MALLDEGAKKRPERPRFIPTIAPELEELLSADDLERLRDQARKKAAAEKKLQAEEQYLAKALEEERRALEPDQELMTIVIDLAPFADKIMIDGKQYFHGHKYEVPRGLFAVLSEIIARTWAHDEEVGSPNRKFYQKPNHIGTGNYGSKPASQDTLVSPRAPNGIPRRMRDNIGV